MNIRKTGDAGRIEIIEKIVFQLLMGRDQIQFDVDRIEDESRFVSPDENISILTLENTRELESFIPVMKMFEMVLFFSLLPVKQSAYRYDIF